MEHLLLGLTHDRVEAEGLRQRYNNDVNHDEDPVS